MRTLLRSTLEFGDLIVPVGLASASTRSGPKLREVHSCGQAIAKRTVCPEHGEVPAAEVTKAFDVGGSLLLPDREKLAACATAPSSVISVFATVDVEEFDPLLVEKAYWLVPDSQGRQGYATIRAALLETNSCALARFTLFKNEYVAAIDAAGEHALVAWTLRTPAETVFPTEIDTLDWSETAPKPGELRHARAVVRELQTPLAKADLGNRSRAALQALLDETLSPPRPRKRQPATA